MQATAIERRRGSPALEQGLLFGIILGLLQILLTIVTAIIHQGSIALMIDTLGGVIALILYLLAGKRAAQQTGRVGTGTFAGIWTGIIGSLIGVVGSLFLTSTGVGSLQREIGTVLQQGVNRLNQSNAITAEQVLSPLTSITGFSGLLLSILIGLILGMFGGLWGRGIFKRRLRAEQRRSTQYTPNTPPPQPKS